MNINLSKRKVRILAVSFLAVIAVAGVMIAGEISPRPKVDSVDVQSVMADGNEHVAIHVRTLAAGTIEPPELLARYRGTVRSRRESSLAFRRSGRVATIKVHEGDRVSQGDLLAELDNGDLDAERKRALADLEVAQAMLSEAINGPRQQTIVASAAEVRRLNADLSLAKANLQRESSLKSRNAGSERSLDAASFMVDQLDASLAAANARHDELIEGTRAEQIAAKRATVAVGEAAVARNAVDFEHTRIVAPYDGVITQRFVDEGAVASPDTPAIHMIEVPPLEARFGLPNEIANILKEGNQVHVEHGSGKDPAFASPLVGTVKRVHPTLSLQTRTRDVDVLLPADAAVVAGETVTLRVPEASSAKTGQEQFWVPTEALVRGTRGLWSVMVAVKVSEAPGHVVQRRDVQVVRTTGHYSEVHGMIEADEMIVVEGLHRIGPGVQVSVKADDHGAHTTRNQ